MKKTASTLCALALGTAAVLSATAVRAQTPEDDKKFLATAAQSDINEIKLSELAETKATNPAVKKFAMTMVTEHKKLEASMKPYATAWGLTPPADLDQDHKDIYGKLNEKSGKDFDKAYIDAMKTDHTKALTLFTDEVKDTKNAKFKVAVEKGKAVVAAHKNMAYDLDKKL